MDVQSPCPLSIMFLTFCSEGILLGVSQQLASECDGEDTYRVGLVDNEFTISLGRLARKAPKQLIVRGT